jgi:uncharacterized membrane protein YdjX (TVP38/TMEM64 family)
MIDAIRWKQFAEKHKWWALLGVLVVGGIVFGVRAADHALFEALRTALGTLQAAVDLAPFQMIVIYFLIYVATAAISLPFGGILTLAAGALFGFWWGLLLALVSATTGALAGFVVSRYLFHDRVQRRFGERLAPINAGLREEGAFYLFSLRMVPVFPYWLANLLMGLTTMPAFTFWWVSVLGLVPIEAAYVFAGTQLAHAAKSHGHVLSFKLLVALLGLALLPLLLRRVVRWAERKYFKHDE